TYQGTLVLGVVTDTQDLSGRVLSTRAVEVSESTLGDAAARFVGDLQQVPPMVSALRREGRRLYQLARGGVEVERAPRPVRVHVLTLDGVEWPRVRFTVRCSTGTYVRTLAHDLGAAVGCGAALESLRRLRSEPFGLERSLPGDRLEPMTAGEVLERGAYTLPE